MTIQKFENVRRIRINGKKYSACDFYHCSHDSSVWIYDGELFCEGWYKKGETIYKKWHDTKLG